MSEPGRALIPQESINKPPSAELRPGQKDEDSLPPYPVLDAIINAYIEQRLKPDQIVNLGYAPEIVLDVISRSTATSTKGSKRHQV